MAALPPLPEQDLCQMRAEASCGNSLVLFLIFLFVAPMQAYANTQANLTMVQRAWIFAIYAEAATAIFCLLGLMWDDPGTIKRTAENCFPLPDIVAEKLANGQSLESVGNVTGEDGRVFCIRCLVWRPDDGNTHHCSTCQRCVCAFDHHCGVRARARCIQNHSSRANRSPVRLHPLPPHLPTPRSPHATPPPPVPVSFPTGLRPVHRGRRLRRQHGVLQNSHHDGRPWLRHVRLVHGSLERPLRELPAPPSRLASTSAPEASMAACTSGGRESSPVLVHGAQRARSADRPPHALTDRRSLG